MSSLCIRNWNFMKGRAAAKKNSYTDDVNDVTGRAARENMNLTQANPGEVYFVKEIATEDEELVDFLFSLGCYEGEPITVVSRKRSSCVVSIKEGRYNIDKDLAEVIVIR